jgi:hypothetical protein
MYFMSAGVAYTRTLTQGVKLTDSRKRVHGIVKKLTQTVKVTQTNSRVHGALRKAVQTGNTNDTTKRWGTYIRVQRDRGDVRGDVLRSVGMFVKIVTTGLVRDYLIHRFLKSKEELVIKSPVCREIEIDSRIH